MKITLTNIVNVSGVYKYYFEVGCDRRPLSLFPGPGGIYDEDSQIDGLARADKNYKNVLHALQNTIEAFVYTLGAMPFTCDFTCPTIVDEGAEINYREELLLMARNANGRCLNGIVVDPIWIIEALHDAPDDSVVQDLMDKIELLNIMAKNLEISAINAARQADIYKSMLEDAGYL